MCRYVNFLVEVVVINYNQVDRELIKKIKACVSFHNDKGKVYQKRPWNLKGIRGNFWTAN